MPVEVHSKGALKDQPAWALLCWVLKESFSGVMMVSANQKISLVFDQGQPIHLNFDHKVGWFEQTLAQENIALPVSLKDYVGTIPKNKLHQFELELLQSGMIQYEEFQKTLHTLLDRAIVELLGFKNGNYVFVQGIPKDVQPVRFKKKFRDMIFNVFLDLAQQQTKWPKVPSSTVFSKLEKAVVRVSDIQMNGKQQRIYRCIDGQNTVDQVIARTGFDERYVKSFIQTLYRMEIIVDQLPMLADVVKPIISDGITTDVSGNEITSPEVKLGSDGKSRVFKSMDDLANKNHFEILGIGVDANSVKIQENYFSMAKEYHPDRLKGLAQKQREEAEKIFSRITEAYNTLSNRNRREEYKSKLKVQSEGISPNGDVNAVLKSETFFQEGISHLKKDNYDQAMVSFEKAIQLYDKEPEYSVQLGWATFRQGVKDKDEKSIHKGYELVRKHGKEGAITKISFYYMGMIEKFLGNLDKAKILFSKAADADPNNAKAASELRLLNMREERETSQSIGIGRLFGKKK
ncbi:MAG: DnaJ domain-containing protein [Bdellovibrionota bacterium]